MDMGECSVYSKQHYKYQSGYRYYFYYYYYYYCITYKQFL